MGIKLKRPQWVISDEGWEFRGKDRFSMEYIEGSNIFTIEVDDSPVVMGVYFETLKLVSGDLILTQKDKEMIRERMITALDTMGGKYEFC